MSKAKKSKAAAGKKPVVKVPAAAAVDKPAAVEVEREKPAAKKKGAAFALHDRVEVLFGDYGHAVGPVFGFKGEQVLVQVLPRQPAVAFDPDNLKLSQAAGTY